MTLQGETNGLHGATCDCGAELELQVCESAAGWYLGYRCDSCGPVSRETDYFRFERTAEIELMCAWRGLRPMRMRTA
jgi:tRNA(Ile2) C34 agmatinyltransferase TiaS